MTETIIVAIISGGLALAGTVITCLATARKNEQNIRVNQAVMETKLEELTREVRHHNNFAERVPLIELKIEAIDRRIAAIEKEGGDHHATVC